MVKEKERTVEVPEALCEDNWGTKKVVIHRLSADEMWALRDESAPTRARVGQKDINVNISQRQLAIGMCAKAVISAPWETGNFATIAKLDWELQEWLQKEVEDLNSPLIKKKTSSTDSPETKEETST